MDLYEHEGKELLRRYGIPVPAGLLATSPVEASAAAAKLGLPVVLKAQVAGGGRGKAGGVRRVEEPGAVASEAEAILGLEIGGERVERLWVEQAAPSGEELYIAATLDRGERATVLLFSSHGGIEVERRAAELPEALASVRVDPLEGLASHHARELLARLEEPALDAVAAIVERLYRCFVESDATLVEINPLLLDAGGRPSALDAKVSIDDSALYRHPELPHGRPEPRESLEAYAAERKVTYVKLDGSVGVLANGAGLAMSTVDVVAAVGGEPANFCDLGGGASARSVVAALEVISRDPQVRAVLLNVFGGITRCDEVARGVLEALETLSLSVPLVVRLDGTNAEEGRRILEAPSRPGLEVSPTMLAAAARAVALAT